jgi:hypothetical protein
MSFSLRGFGLRTMCIVLGGIDGAHDLQGMENLMLTIVWLGARK